MKLPTETVAVLDFETTGLSPAYGDRPTEIAIALLRNGEVVDRFQSLMNAGRSIPADVVQLTGITNEMLSSAPPISKVMREAALFVGQAPLVAHNANFDRKFWEAELSLLSTPCASAFACTMLLARRIYPHSPNHQLGTLVRHLTLPTTGRAHRAMADAEVTAKLWSRLCSDIVRTYGLETVPHELMLRLQRTARADIETVFRSHLGTSIAAQRPRAPAPKPAPEPAPAAPPIRHGSAPIPNKCGSSQAESSFRPQNVAPTPVTRPHVPTPVAAPVPSPLPAPRPSARPPAEPTRPVPFSTPVRAPLPLPQEVPPSAGSMYPRYQPVPPAKPAGFFARIFARWRASASAKTT